MEFQGRQFQGRGSFGYLDIWNVGYLDTWISGYLDYGKNNLLLHPQSEILCGAALPDVFFLIRTCPWCFATYISVPCILPEQYLTGLGYIDAD